MSGFAGITGLPDPALSLEGAMAALGYGSSAPLGSAAVDGSWQGATGADVSQISNAGSVKELADAMNDALRNLNFSVGFGVYEETGEIYIKILDRLSGSVVKTIPPEELLAMAAKMIQMRETLGLVVDLTQ